MKKFKHQCSCGKIYFDDDPEVYFCSSCIFTRKGIAQEVDKKMRNKISSRVDKGFETLCATVGKTMPSQTGGLATFFKASDLGI